MSKLVVPGCVYGPTTCVDATVVVVKYFKAPSAKGESLLLEPVSIRREVMVKMGKLDTIFHRNCDCTRKIKMVFAHMHLRVLVHLIDCGC